MRQYEVADYSGLEIPPLCEKCGAVIRPKVVLFGEPLPYDQCQILMRELATGFDIYFSVGTTSVFYYIAEPIRNANAQGKPTIEINPDETEVSDIVDIKIPMGAAEALDTMWKQYNGKDKSHPIF
jgi:NAD-dependent deacetylase